MRDMTINVIAILITVPFVPMLILYFITKTITGHQQKAVHVAVNWTTFLYIISSLTMFYIIFGQMFIGIFLIIFLLLFTLLVIAQWRIKTEINFVRTFKIFWRVCFIVFFILYVVLVLIGIVERMFF